MAYRKLLLPLSATAAGEAALATALRVARHWSAHLAAVLVLPDGREVAPLAGEGLSGAMIEEMMTATARDSAARGAAMTARFDAAVAELGLATAPRDGGASATLTRLTGREEDVVPGLARLADLTVLAHPSEDDAAASESLHAVLFDSGRPALVAPQAAPVGIGRRCAVAWNGTAESATALWAMLPWLREADAVCVLHAAEYQRRGPAADSVLPYLALHGIEATIETFRPVDRDVGAGLLAAAEGFDADLLGMGAYSHSRLRQLILGGVTRHVLAHGRLPVLMCR